MTQRLPDHPKSSQRLLDAGVHLLDRVVLDRSGVPVTMVDDLRLDWDRRGGPGLAELVLGSGLVARFGHAHEPRRRRHAAGWWQVSRLDSAVWLDADRNDLDVTWFERWLRDRVVGRIPGGRHAGE